MPPEGMAVVGVNVREMGTEDLPTTRSEEAMVKATDDTREKMLPDDKALDGGHKPLRKLTPTESAVGKPIVKPLMVMVTAAEALMTAPEIVIATAVAEVAPHTAVNPWTLLAPEPTVGTTADAKKLPGNKRFKALPDVMRIEEENTKVTGTYVLPDTRFEVAMLKEENEIFGQYEVSHMATAVKEDKADTGVFRWVVVPSPTCAKSNTAVSTIRAFHKERNSTLNTNNKHHLAFAVVSPAGDPAAARQRTGMILQTKRQNAMTPQQNNLATHFTQQKASGHINIKSRASTGTPLPHNNQL